MIYLKEIYPPEVMHKIFSNMVVGSLTFLQCPVVVLSACVDAPISVNVSPDETLVL